jgi:hypothetical protein
MRQQSGARPRSEARSDHGPPGDHGTGDALPAPFGRLFPDLASRPPTGPERVPDPAPARTTDRSGTAATPAPGGAEGGLGRLVAHDLGIVADPAAGVLPSPAEGPPTLALDGLYGPGPLAAPQLYDPSDRARLRPPPDGPRHRLAAVHDALVDAVRGEGVVFWPVVFSEARRRMVHRYQHTVLDETLPRWVGRPLVDAIRRHGRRFYRPADVAFVPLELLALAPWLVPTGTPARPCPAAWALPPGRAVARAVGVAPLASTDIDPGAPLDDYVMAESRIVAGGRRLGPVGGRILAETLIGVLELDVDSCVGPLAPIGRTGSRAAGRTPCPPPPGPAPGSSPRPAGP